MTVMIHLPQAEYRARSNGSTVVFFLVCILILLSPAGAIGVPAIPHELVFKQPDGTTFHAYLRGDEYFSWIETEKGYIIIRNPKTLFYEYAVIHKGVGDGKERLVPSGIVVEEGMRKPEGILPVCRSTMSRLATEARREEREIRKQVSRKPVSSDQPLPNDPVF